MNRKRPLSRAFRSFLLLSLLLLTFALADAQSASATLSGTVTDQNGAIVPGAIVIVMNAGTRLQRETTTSDEGYFTVPLLPPSTYTVTVRRDGFAPVEVQNVVLNVGDQKALQIQLKAGDVNATVTIDSTAEMVRTDGSVGTVVDRQFVANIPLNGRSFQSLITLTPGVVLTASPNSFNYDGQFSVNGQRPSGNSFSVDGVSANFGIQPGTGSGPQTAGNNPGLTAFGTTQSLASVDALQEFKLQTSSYAAEYGRQPGGQISIVTRSGTNQFHGSAFDYLRNDVFDANDWFANRARQPKPPERQNDFGGTLGGPVVVPGLYNGHNRTFFFFSYEGLQLRLPTFRLTNVPSLTLRQQAPAAVRPILNAFPLPNGRDLGNGLAEFSASFSDPSTLNATSIRIDESVGSKVRLFGRYARTPAQRNTRGSFNLSNISLDRTDSKVVTLGVTASFTPRLINDLRFNYSGNYGPSNFVQDTFGGATPLPRSVLILSQYESSTSRGIAGLRFPGGTSASQPFVDTAGTNNEYIQRQVNVVDNLSYSVGTHQLKFGVDYRQLRPITSALSYQSEAYFSSAQNVLDSVAPNGVIQNRVPFKPIFSNFSAYAQDTWKVSHRLTFDLGLRWEVNPAPDEATGRKPLAVTQITNLSTMQLAPRGTPLWKTTFNNFAPRVGVAYQLRQKPGRELVLRGGFGVYYDTGTNTASDQFNDYPYQLRNNLSNVRFPLDPNQVAPQAVPLLTGPTPPYPSLRVYNPSLKLPYTLQWNVAAERSLGQSQVITLSYVGAAGRRLVHQDIIIRNDPNFPLLFLTDNKAASSYNSLQVQFQRRLSRGLQALASYTWSHAIDDDSAGTTFPLRPIQRGNADFDVRQVFAAAVTYDIPAPGRNFFERAILSRWSLDTTVHAQAATPVDIVATQVINPADGTLINVRANVIAGVPFYLDDPTVPGGRKINRAAFSIPAAGQAGTSGRNVVRGLPAWQVDLALRRQFKLTEKLNLQFRAEAFNVFNHPNFGAIQTNLNAANFGQATNMLNRQLGGLNQLYQIGGPRSLQFALKLQF